MTSAEGEKQFSLATAEQQYEKDDKLTRRDILELVEWVREQPYLALAQMSEMDIIPFYHVSGYSQHKAKDLIEKQMIFKAQAPELFEKYRKFRYDIWDSVYYFVADDNAGRAICYCGFRDPDPKKFDVRASLPALIQTVIASLFLKGISPRGYTFVFDADKTSMAHLATVSISLARNFLHFVQEAIQIHVAEIHVINLNPVVDKILFLLKPFIKKELYEKISFHSNMTSFYAKVPKELMPSDLGGQLATRESLHEETKMMLNSVKEKIEVFRNQRADLSKRANHQRKKDLCDSFKKIDLD